MDINKDGLTSEEEYFHKQQQEQLAKLREIAAMESEASAAEAAKELHYHMCGKCAWPNPSILNFLFDFQQASNTSILDTQCGSLATCMMMQSKATDNPECVGCHTTAYGEAGGLGELTAGNIRKYRDVQCEACHGPMGGHAGHGLLWVSPKVLMHSHVPQALHNNM